MTCIAVSVEAVRAGGAMTHAVSEEANRIREQLTAILTHASASRFGGGWEAVRDRIAELAGECSRPNWDGHSAHPVPAEAIFNALMATEMMPAGIGMPEIVPEPSGNVGFEWEDETGSVFVIAFSSGFEIHYAGVFSDGSKIHGTERFLESMSPRLLSILLQFRDRER